MKQLDPVALLQDMPENNLKRGQVGATVEVLDANTGVYEVEFVSHDGTTYAMLTLSQEQLMLLHYEPAT
jgi:hypothetical protein